MFRLIYVSEESAPFSVSNLLESLIESATRGRLDDPQLRLCRSMLTSLRGRSKGAVARA